MLFEPFRTVGTMDNNPTRLTSYPSRSKTDPLPDSEKTGVEREGGITPSDMIQGEGEDLLGQSSD